MESLKHGTSETLELYALGRLDPGDAGELEEHLMICSNCQEKFEEVEAFALGMRDVLRRQPVPVAKPAVDWFAWLRRPSFALAGGFALLLLVGVMFSRSGSRAVLPVASIQLSAMRGDTMTVPVAKEFDITLADAPEGKGPFRVEMVDATGHQVWSGVPSGSAANAAGGKVAAKGLEVVKAQVNSIEPGDYFLRLFGADGSLLHEYGLRITK